MVMLRNLFENLGAGLGAARGATQVSFHDRIAGAVAESFDTSELNVALGSSTADVVIVQGERLAVIEVKTGDPRLPLPSSTVAQMKIFADEAQQKFSGKHVCPVVVTNYLVSPEEKEELEVGGVKFVLIKSADDLKALPQNLAQALFFHQLRKAHGQRPDSSSE